MCYFCKWNLFNFFVSTHFRELSNVKCFVRISFHQKPKKANVFEAQVRFFLAFPIFYKAVSKVYRN